ncbi:DUF1800 family protein [Persicitalea sp.]|uniref:DUF1800 domain-containing protein n=1 Tax=Persicitalea sp. TaxID=3100273 RepID=UPI00359457F6
MPYLDLKTQPLDSQQAAHLLRRATFGPTPSEITSFVGLTPAQAVQALLDNVSYVSTPPPPIEFDETKPNAGQTYLDKPFNGDRNFWFGTYIKYWWMGQMARQDVPPSLLDKLTLFWQNHFVTTREEVDDYRFLDRYLRLLRDNALGNFRFLVVAITKDPAMLRYLNGNQNRKGSPNENYARELQELFTVGNKDFAGNNNYTEDDVKAAARALTGWNYTNFYSEGSTSFETTFTSNRHDTTDKAFSSYYGNTVVAGRSGTTAGDDELNDLVTMLLDHPETPKFICRKLYRWYVNPNVTQDIEDNVIVPLATFFKSPGNDYAILPVVKKLLTSDIFFDSANRGAIVKSPAELMIGSIRFFEQPVPNMMTDYVAFRKLMEFFHWNMNDMQLQVLDQSSVFGYDPYYQPGYSANWVNTTTLALRSNFTDALIWRWFEVKPGYQLGIDLLAWVSSMQPNFSDLNTPAIPCETVLDGFLENLFATDLFPAQKEFLIDTIMMMGFSRTTWLFEWNAYRADPNDEDKQNTILWRTRSLMRYLLRMAEYHVF